MIHILKHPALSHSFHHCRLSTTCNNTQLNSVVNNYTHSLKSGILSGMEISLKENITIPNTNTTCSSLILRNYCSVLESTVYTKLLDSGAVITGNTNMDEFGMGSFNVNSCHGPAKNPHDLSRVTGGSSGGAAASLSLSIDVAIGSDTGGSVRLPASYCGVFGFKGSYGLVSRYGLIPYAHSLDTVGLMSNSIIKLQSVFDVIRGRDPKDPTTLDIQKDQSLNNPLSRLNFQSSRDQPLTGFKVGVPIEYHVTGISNPVLEKWSLVIQKLENLGATIVQVSLPHTHHALSTYYIIASSEAYSNLAKYDGVRYGIHGSVKQVRASFGKEVKKRLMLGAYLLRNDYLETAQRVRSLVQKDFDSLLRSVNPLHDTKANGDIDFLVTPASMDVAPTIKDVEDGGINPYLNDVFTVPASLAGLPCVVIPTHSIGQLPIGIQLIAQYGDDDFILEAAKLLA